MGLRERKKQQTRRLIADTAARLFAERGFEQVTVAQVAQEAEVAQATVFNYFPTKEDLFYSGLEAFGDELVAAVAGRPEGEPALVAFQRFVLTVPGMAAESDAGDADALDRLRTVSRVIEASPALRAREVQALARITDALAAQLAAEQGAPDPDIPARVVATALMGVHRILIDYVRQRVLAEDDPAKLAAGLRKHGEQAFALLSSGLADAFRRPAAPST